MKIITLVENSSGRHRTMKNEHGLSFLVDTGTHRVLFDTGQSRAFLDNADLMGLDLRESLDVLVMSHGHYDHTGGLPALLKETRQKLDIRVGRGFFAPKYSLQAPSVTYLGPSFSRQTLELAGHSVSEADKAMEELVPGVWLVTDFERQLDPDWPNPRFVLPGPGGWLQDAFEDEVSLVLETARGLVLLAGCSHPGILNMMATVEQRFGQKLHAVLGGTHLVEAQGERLEKVLLALSQRPELVLGLSHCTGDEATRRIRELCPGYYPNNTGSQLWLD